MSKEQASDIAEYSNLKEAAKKVLLAVLRQERCPFPGTYRSYITHFTQDHLMQNALGFGMAFHEDYKKLLQDSEIKELLEAVDRKTEESYKGYWISTEGT